MNEGLTLLDKNDTFTSTAYSFAGVSDMVLQQAQQVSGAAEVPLIVLMSQSPAGLGDTGDVDLRIYYDSVKAKQELQLRDSVSDLMQVEWQSTFGKPTPEDFEFEFVPLWQLTETDKAANAKTNTETVIGGYESGLVPAHVAMKDLQAMSADTGLFSGITDEDIEEAELEPPPSPDMPEGTSAIGAGGETLKLPEPETVPTVKAVSDAAFNETDHPRKDDGEFSSGGGQKGIHDKDKDAAINFLLGSIKDKDYDDFIDNFDKAAESAKVGKVDPKTAASFKRSHNFTFESDPDNESLNKKGERGKEVSDPSVVLEFNGEHYVLDGQHRLNKAVKEGKSANVAIIKGDFLKKYGITEKTFEGKKSYTADRWRPRLAATAALLAAILPK